MATAYEAPSTGTAADSRFNAPARKDAAPPEPGRTFGQRLLRLRERLGRVRPWGLGLWDWTFIFFLWLTLFYAAAIVVAAVQTGDWDIDFMPISAGIPFILIAWPAVRVGDRMAKAIERLDDDAGLILAEGDTLEALRADLNRGVFVREIAVACSIALLMSGILFALLAKGDLAAIDSGWIVLLGPVLVVVGAALGGLVGRIWGYGRLRSVLERRNARFAGVLTRETRRTLAEMRGLFLYGFGATVALCHWFIAWFAAWLVFGFRGGGYYEVHAGLFWIMLAVSLVLSIFAGYWPLMTLLRHLGALYGGYEAGNGIRSQLRQARIDLAAVRGVDPVAEHDLAAFIAEKEADPISAGRAIKWAATAVLVWQSAWLAISAVPVFFLYFGNRPAMPKAAWIDLLYRAWS